jgi:ribosomal protein S18 acetylase RimI-like enzyme
MLSLPTIEELLTRERAYYEVLSECARRQWGVIGLDANNPSSPHSNHAYADVRLTPDQLPAVLNEVADYYTANGIEPRLRFHIPPNDPGLNRIAEERGWRTRLQEEMWRAWPSEAGWHEAPQAAGLTLCVVGPEALDALQAVATEGADSLTATARAKRWAALIRNRETDCLLARIHGEPAALLACVWRDRWGCVEGVRTRERFRHRGLCTAMICHIQRLAAERGAAGLLLYTEVHAADRIYERAGFELVRRLRRASIWRGCSAQEFADSI